MRLLDIVRSWLGAVLRRTRMESEMSEELRFHVEAYAEDLVRGGTPRTEAMRRAKAEFGGAERVKEECREARGIGFIESLLQDLRFGLRALARTPGFTAIAMVTLALGIGANTAIFSVVNGVLLRPLPFSHPNSLVRITQWYPEGAYVAMRDALKTMDLAAYHEGRDLNLSGVGEPERVYGTAISADFFSLLGVRTEVGRTFIPGEDQPGKDNVVILSHALWQGKFGGDPNVIGRSVMLEGVSRVVVGVMPADFQFGSPNTQFWIPLHLDPRNLGTYWGSAWVSVIGRLRRGSTEKQAGEEFREMAPYLRSLFPWRMPDVLWVGASVVRLQESIVGEVQSKLLILLGAIGLVLLIACANVANLLLARAATRQKEMAVRAALGAGRWRICRQLLTESAMLGLGGGGLGLLLAMNGLVWLKAVLPADTPRLAGVTIDWRVMAFAAAVGILTGVFFGLASALHASKIDLTESLKSGGQLSIGSRNRLRNTLAIAEIGVAVVLVIGAGLLVKSLRELAHVDPGFRTESVVAARVTPDTPFCSDFRRCENFYNELLVRVEALPGVKDAAIVNALPLALGIQWSAFAADVEDNPRDPRNPAQVLLETIITPDYLHVMGIPLLRGRAFTAADTAPGAPPVALVTSATAKKYWPNQDPIGKHVKAISDKSWTTIVGVVADVKEDSLASMWPDGVDGAMYEPFGNGRGKLMAAEKTLVLRASGSANWADALRKTVASLNPDVPVSDVKTMHTIVSESMTAPRSTMSLFAIFAGLALILGAIGIYGVISYTVTQRIPELGIRMALGAQKRDVMRLVMGEGARLAFLGVGIGVAAGFALTRLMASLLYGVSASDPLTFTAVAIILVVVALLATYLPARRAMRVDPMAALRYE